MLHKIYVIVIFSFLTGTTLLSAEETNTTKPLPPLVIMPLGDSITYGIEEYDEEHSRNSKVGGYRAPLWYMLKDLNRTIQFVGSKTTGQSIKPFIDPNHEGHPGWTMGEIGSITFDTINKYHPNTILLHIGTNDRSTTNPDGITKILNTIDTYERNNNKIVHVLVALIIDREIYDKRISQFNTNLKKLLQKRILNGDAISIVDMYHDAKLTGSDYANNTHPNDSGYAKMARVWFNALREGYNHNLRLFPATLVNRSYLKSVNYNDAANSVAFTTKLPVTGITF